MIKTLDRIFEPPAELIDRVFDVPVKMLDETLNFSDELTVPENPRYEKYRRGLHRLEAGACLFVGGLAAAGAGVEGGGDAALLGWMLGYLGGMKAIWNAIQIDQYYV